MVWYHTAATLAPSLIPLFLVYLLWSAVEEVPGVAVFVFLFSLLPLLIQLCWWGLRQTQQGDSGTSPLPHPFGFVLPLGLPLVLPLEPVGEAVARNVPSLCRTVAGEQVMTSRPGSPTQKASFFVHFHGWGNQQSFEMTAAVIVYTGEGKKADDLYVHLPGMQGHYTNSYTTFFPVTREVVANYVRGSDDFSPNEVEAVSGELWDLLNRYAEKRDMPPMTDHFLQDGEEPRIVSYPPASTVYLCSCLLAVATLAVPSWLLARRYCRQVLNSQARGSHNGIATPEPT
jgi:hypothetical protein